MGHLADVRPKPRFYGFTTVADHQPRLTKTTKPGVTKMTVSRSTTKRASLAAVLTAGLAALSIAAPAQADLTKGGAGLGCIQGIQVGHVHNPDGTVSPICYTVN
jgi:hypothetical protein